jgi:hypothetical protein
MSQMNVFQKLGHAYIPIGYIRLTSDERAAQHAEISLAKRNDTQDMSQHDKIQARPYTLY